MYIAQSCIEKSLQSIQKSPILLVEMNRMDLKKLNLLDFMSPDSEFEKSISLYFPSSLLEYLKNLKKQVKRMNLQNETGIWFYSTNDSSFCLHLL